MLEEVVRQLSQDLSCAEKAGSSSQTLLEAGSALKASPATEREVKALNARVSSHKYTPLMSSWLDIRGDQLILLHIAGSTCLSRTSQRWTWDQTES